MSAEALDEIQWKSPEWIQQFGLHTSNVLDYFSELPFYDRTSNNQVLRMQFQFQQIPPNVHPQKYLQDKLTEMVGTEFVIAFAREPDFWVVRRQHRLDPQTTITENDYYIIGANVYQSPLIYDVLLARLLLSVLYMKNCLGALNKLGTFSISEGGHVYATDLEAPGDSRKQTSKGYATPNPPSTAAIPSSVAATTDAALTSMVGSGPSTNAEISALAFDKLLNSVVASANNEGNTYLDDIPLYGKGSTVEQLGLKLNLDDE